MTDTTLRYPIRQDVARSQSALQADLQSLVPSLEDAGVHTGHHRWPWGIQLTMWKAYGFPFGNLQMAGYHGYVDVFVDCWLSTWESNCKKHKVFGMGRLLKKTQKWLAGRILLNHRNEMLVQGQLSIYIIYIFGCGLKTEARFPGFQKSEVPLNMFFLF